MKNDIQNKMYCLNKFSNDGATKCLSPERPGAQEPRRPVPRRPVPHATKCPAKIVKHTNFEKGQIDSTKPFTKEKQISLKTYQI